MRTRSSKSARSTRNDQSPAGEQLLLDWKQHGGPRKGAGRKRTVHSRVEHRTRPVLKAYQPLHVTSRVARGLPSLRSPREKELILQAFRDKCEREGWRLVHFSIQSNHLHLIAEAGDRQSFTRGLRGLLITLGKRLNRLWRRTGRVLDRAREDLDAPCRLAWSRPYDAPPLTRTVAAPRWPRFAVSAGALEVAGADGGAGPTGSPPAGLESPKPR